MNSTIFFTDFLLRTVHLTFFFSLVKNLAPASYSPSTHFRSRLLSGAEVKPHELWEMSGFTSHPAVRVQICTDTHFTTCKKGQFNCLLSSTCHHEPDSLSFPKEEVCASHNTTRLLFFPFVRQLFKHHKPTQTHKSVSHTHRQKAQNNPHWFALIAHFTNMTHLICSVK